MRWAATLLVLLALAVPGALTDELGPSYRLPGDVWGDGLLQYRVVDQDALTDTLDTGAIADNATTTVEQQIDLMAAAGAVLCSTSNSYTLQVTVSMCLPSSEYQKLWTLSLSSISSAKQRAISFSYVDCSAAVGAPTPVTPISGPPRLEVMLGRTTPIVGGAVAVRVCPNLDCAVLPTDIVVAALPTVSLIVPASLVNMVDCASVLSNGVSYNEGVSGMCKCDCPGTSTSTGNSNSCSCTGGKGLLNGDCQTCPTGSTVVSGVCTCSGTKGFIGNVCSTCPTGSSIINGICTCSGGRTIINGVCTCPSSSTFINNECVCSGGRTLVNNVCTCPSTSSLVGTGASAVCRCSGSQGFINGVCSTCPTGSSIINGICTCSGGRTIINGVCTCPSSSTFINNECVCSGGRTLVNNVCTCPSTSSLVGTGASAVCRCSGSQGFINGVCSTCPSGSSVVDGVCSCSGGRSLVNGVCTCPSTSTFDGTACVCSGGQNLVNNVCTCPSTSSLVGTGASAVCRCSGSQGFINGVCSTCPSGSSVVDGACSCSGGRLLVNGVCTCPSTSTFDGTACVCSGGQNLVNNVCTCPSTSSLVGTGASAVCRCSGSQGFINGVCSTCPSGSSVVDGACSCSGGRLLVNGVCTCPSTSTFDGTACVCSGGQNLVNIVCTCPSTSSLVGTGASAVCRCSGSQGFVNGVCSTCPSGSSVVDGVCVCSAGREIANGQCACPSGQEFRDGNCVPTCFWTANNVGYDCPWEDPEKQSLTLNEDCKISAPAAMDSYVADERTNKYDGALEDPVISISATKQGGSVGVTAKATWKEYFLTPTTLENEITFETFGVFDLEMKATDYGGMAKCSGCVAIVDKYPPTAETKCESTVVTTLIAPASYADGKLAEAIAQEGKFTAFYSTDNVKNNDGASGANERCDDVTAEMQDFFAPSASSLTSVGTQCFDTGFAGKLLAKAPGTNLLTSATQAELDALQCTRCCSKSLTLKEYYYDYKCGTDPADAEKKIATSDQCAFNYCLNMPGDALIEASAAVSESAAEETATVLGGLPTSVAPALNVVHRSITCTAVNKGCSYTPTLGDLFTHTSSWGPGGLDEHDVNDYVYWRYAVDTENWHQWSDSATLTFTNTQTTVYVEAWTGCGRAYRETFTVVLHPHSPHNVCESFRSMWTENSPTPRTDVESHMCTYPGSDFVMLTFAYDSDSDSTHDADTVKGKYTDVKCYVTLAEGGPGSLDKVKEAELPLTWPSAASGRIQISKQLALELVNDPETAEATDVKVRCDFTFKYFNSDDTEDEKCAYPFTMKDCDVPELELVAPAECALGSPTGVPGPYEACSGSVLTTVSGATQPLTELKAVTGECCASSPALTCAALTESTSESGVKRCEPSPVTVPLSAQMVAMELRVDDEDRDESKLAVSASLLAASALVAIVALVVVKQRVAGTARLARETDDVYVTLLD